MKGTNTYTVQPNAAPRRIVSEMGWHTYQIVLGVITVVFIAVAALSIYYAIDAEHRQNALALKEQDDVNSLAAADEALLSELLSVNTSIYGNLAYLAAALNLTTANGNTFMQDLQAEIASSVATIDASIALRAISVNDVDGDNSTHNIDLVPGPGITVTPHPLTNTIGLGNSGVLSMTAGNGGLSFSAPNGPVIAYNHGVLSLSGISPPVLSGNIELLGLGMLSVYGNANSSTITVDASLLVIAVSNLQTQQAAQQAEISDLQLNVTTLEQKITNIQLAEYVIQESLNGSVTNINVTLTELLSAVYTLQGEVAALQAQLANQTQGTTIATGTMMPWTGAPSTVAEGYLLCDGTEYAASAYAALYTVIGTQYCEGNCSVGSFRVPNMQGRVPVGLGGGGLFQAAVGTQVGSEQQTLSTTNLPSHTHTASTASAGAHSHTALSANIGDLNVLIDEGDGTGNGDTSFFSSSANTHGAYQCSWGSFAINNCGGEANFYDNTGNPYYVQQLTSQPATSAGLDWGSHSHSTNTEGTHTHTMTVGNTGSGTEFSVTQPSVVMQYMIKT